MGARSAGRTAPFWGGRRLAAISLALSSGFVAGGEWLFGAGYGVGADIHTIVALTTALTATNLLVVGFALYARQVGHGYRILFDGVRMGVMRVDSAGRILGANPAALSILGIPDASSVIGTRLGDLLHAPDLASLDSLTERGLWTGELEVREPGSRGSLHAALAAAADPASRTVQIYLADRSTEAMQELELERQAKLSSLGEALAGVAHELNNPLTVVLAHAQMGLEEESCPDDVTESLSLITSEARRMRDIVRELVGFSRKDTEAESTDVDEVVSRLVRVQRITMGAAVDVQADARSGATVDVSAPKLEQVLINLLSNAAYSVRQDGSTVRVTTRLQGDTVEIAVEDDGPGIAPEIVERLFEPFATTKPAGEGTGLGLSISRRLARSWGGDLRVRSVEPRGARFEMAVPVARPQTPDAPRPDVAHVPAPAEPEHAASH